MFHVFKNLGVIQTMAGPTSKTAKPEPYQLAVLGPHQTPLSPFCMRWGNRQIWNKVDFFAQGPSNPFILYACIWRLKGETNEPFFLLTAILSQHVSRVCGRVEHR